MISPTFNAPDTSARKVIPDIIPARMPSMYLRGEGSSFVDFIGNHLT
jgi:hypothetical protein